MTRPLAILASALGTDPRQIPTAARTLGFVGLQFDIFNPAFNLADLSVTGRREFLRLLAAQNQQLVSLRVSAGPRGLLPGADIDKILSHAQRAFESTRALGCGILCLDLGPLPPAPRSAIPKPSITPAMAGLLILPERTTQPTSPPPPEDPIDPAAIASCDTALAELGRLADRHSVMLAMRSELSSFAALDRAIAAARCPWFAVDLDPVAMLTDDWPPDEIVSRLGNLIHHVRIRDAVKGHSHRTQPASLGQGNVNWPELLHRLDDDAYHGPFTVDPTDLPDRTTAARLAVKLLKDHGA